MVLKPYIPRGPPLLLSGPLQLLKVSLSFEVERVIVDCQLFALLYTSLRKEFVAALISFDVEVRRSRVVGELAEFTSSEVVVRYSGFPNFYHCYAYVFVSWNVLRGECAPPGNVRLSNSITHLNQPALILPSLDKYFAQFRKTSLSFWFSKCYILLGQLSICWAGHRVRSGNGTPYRQNISRACGSGEPSNRRNFPLSISSLMYNIFLGEWSG